MEVFPYRKENHYGTVSEWACLHGISPLDSLPEMGIMAYNDKTPVACAFLRRVEGGLGIFDGLMSNPQCSSKDRDEALSLVIDAITAIACNQGIKGIIAWVKDKNTLERAIRHGYSAQQEQRLIFLPLSRSGV